MYEAINVIVHQKKKCCHVFTLMFFKTYEIFLIKSLWFCGHSMEVNRAQCCLFTNILQNIFYCVLSKKESHMDVE